MATKVRDGGLGALSFPESAWTGVLADYRDAVSVRSEVPGAFHWGAIVTALGLAFGRKIAISYGVALYLNFYCLLIGPTGSKKSTPIAQALDLFKNVSGASGILKTYGVASAEGILALLAKEPGTRLLIVEDELRSILKKAQQSGNGQLITQLCRLYDCREQVDLPTRTNPLVAERPTTALICAATSESLEDCISENETYGGFLNRFVPLAGVTGEPEPWPQQPDQRLRAALVRDLDDLIDHYNGPHWFQVVDPEARQMWEQFYGDFHRRQHTAAAETFAALTHRLHVHVMKFAMLFAVIRKAKTINADDLTRALELGHYIDSVFQHVVTPLGQNPAARLESKIEALLTQNAMKRRELAQKLSGRVKSYDLRRTLDNLIDLEKIVEMDDGLLGWADADYMRRYSKPAPGMGEDGRPKFVY